ncbi:MAG: hypothetical protein PWP04_976 [Candidatus Atribacteria bacterium]|nr:hypothetical protein [Candidatus Atribacteria bacterium]
MPKCNLENNLSYCSCSYPGCPRKGKCCECVTYHRSAGELPGCFFPPEVERTYDRSIRRFVSVYQNT